jgi:hypothetical protein
MSSHPDCDPDWLAKYSATYTHASSVVVRSVTESRLGAVIKVERIELTEAGRAMLTAGAYQREMIARGFGNGFVPWDAEIKVKEWPKL